MQAVCDRLLEIIQSAIDNGTKLPWHKPWERGNIEMTEHEITIQGNPNMPFNGSTGRPYSGLNAMFLDFEATGNGFPSNAWVTFNQAMRAVGYEKEEGSRKWEWARKSEEPTEPIVPVIA